MSRTISAASVQAAMTFLDEFGDERPVDRIERLAAKAIHNPRAVATLAVLLAAMAEDSGRATLPTLLGLEPAAGELALREAHRRYARKARHPWVVSGERLYQRIKKRRQRDAYVVDQRLPAAS
jgi:hypothetical protein